MASVVQVKITGGAELYRALEERPRQVGKAIIRAALRSGARIWWKEMKDRVHRGWHVFRNTKFKGQRLKGRSREFGVIAQRGIAIKVSVRGDELGGIAQVGPTRKGAFWSLFLEFGTSRQGKFPFIRPAFETKKQAVLEEFIRKTKEELKNTMGMR
jgi:HK97 gp10 family phage protein